MFRTMREVLCLRERVHPRSLGYSREVSVDRVDGATMLPGKCREMNDVDDAAP